MFTITLTRQQLYELYDEGPEATIHLIEGLLEELADQERILGERQQLVIDAQQSVTSGRPRSSSASRRS